MELTYIGHSCFKIKGKDLSLVIDPYDPKKMGFKLPKLDADVLLISHDHFDHNYKEGVSGYRLIITGSGEYETKDVFIYGIQVFHDDKDGQERGINTIYLIEIDGFSILHLGDLGHQLSRETLEKIPNVDVLLIPVGGKFTLDEDRAVQVISDIEPGLVIPMHYSTSDSAMKDELAPLSEFLEEMGVAGKEIKQEKLKLTSKSDIPEDTTVVVLEPQH